jgi:hypothetical protein
MRKYLVIGLGAMFAVALAAPTFAQDNVSGLGSGEGAAGTIFITSTANNNYFSKRVQCNDPTLTSTVISAAVADCCVAGDIWQLNLSKGTKAALYKHVANVAQFTAGAASFAPDVFSPDATIGTSVKKVNVDTTSGNSAPGGLPAGLTTRIATNGGGPVCSVKGLVNGS